MRQLVAVIGILWAALNLVVAALLLTGSFTATTAAKEGIAAQLALLVGGALIAIFSALLVRSSWSLLSGRVEP
jgi:ABC-type polysaccharide/polyol phosphate export permease